jgi:cobalt-zinc-cadmium efflux system membrane fusion protein
VKNTGIVIGVILALLLGGGLYYRFTHLKVGGEQAGHGEEKGHKEEGKHGEEEHDEHEEALIVRMAPETQREHGVVVAVAKMEQLAGAISATGKVEVNADRIAHVSPRIAGKLVAVKASLGDAVAAGQTLALLDSVELGEAVSRYRQTKTRLALAQSNMERVKALVEKKIAARKEILQAETDYQTALAELQADEERLQMYGLAKNDLADLGGRQTLLPVRSPIGGVITEKHAIVGELADPAANLYTVADLSSVWVLVDINEKDLAKVRKGQEAVLTVGAFPDQRFRGRIAYIADVVDEATRTVKARVEVPNPGRILKPEMFAAVELALPAEAPPTLAIPEEAIQEIEGQKVVFVTGDGTEFAPRPLKLGRAAGGLVEVVGGLSEGEHYAARGSFLLKSELMKGELGEHGH